MLMDGTDLTAPGVAGGRTGVVEGEESRGSAGAKRDGVTNQRHVVDWGRIVATLELACEMRGVSLRDVAEEIGIAASGLTRLRQGKHLSADCLAALVAWLYPHSIPKWIKPGDAGLEWKGEQG